jgi:hypothetical protein
MEMPDENGDAIDEAVWESLRHPAMWQALLSLNPDTQKRAVEGDTTARCQLAWKFIEWFGHKLVLRREERFEYFREDNYHALFETLRYVARNSLVKKRNDQESNWIVPARDAPMRISDIEARILYRESILAGLIEEDALRTWRWRHSVVYDCLAGHLGGAE